MTPVRTCVCSIQAESSQASVAVGDSVRDGLTEVVHILLCYPTNIDPTLKYVHVVLVEQILTLLICGDGGGGWLEGIRHHHIT